MSALFVQSLNELIDVHEKRVTLALHYRLPGVIWLVLYGLLILAMAIGGFDTGFSGRRRLIGITLPTAMAFAVVILLVVALDRPHHSFDGRRDAVMLDVQESIRQPTESQP